MEQRTLRVGLTAILCALVLRMFAAGVPGKLLARLGQTNIAAFFLTLETGRDVRFSPSMEAFSPDFMESPAAATIPATEPPLPFFSDPDAVKLYNASGKSPDIAALLEKPLQWKLRGEEPTVLILHTHTTESYTKNGEQYTESAAWRTTDENYNMLSIGQRVREKLEENGIVAIQDREIHDYPSYNGSYTDARESIRAYLEAYPTIRLVLDLHRDASGGNNGQMRTRAWADGKPSAQLMVVIGANHEGYEGNLSLGLKLHAMLEKQHPGITRPLQLRGARYNQDMLEGGLLVEVGAAGNTRQEALTAAEALAQAIGALAGGTEGASEEAGAVPVNASE